jgi:hypothetical protein
MDELYDDLLLSWVGCMYREFLKKLYIYRKLVYLIKTIEEKLSISSAPMTRPLFFTLVCVCLRQICGEILTQTSQQIDDEEFVVTGDKIQRCHS